MVPVRLDFLFSRLCFFFFFEICFVLSIILERYYSYWKLQFEIKCKGIVQAIFDATDEMEDPDRVLDENKDEKKAATKTKYRGFCISYNKIKFFVFLKLILLSHESAIFV